jgi:hypothetical protein
MTWEEILAALDAVLAGTFETPEAMAADAAGALAAGTNMTLVRRKGQKMPPKFPRGELLSENFDGSRCYSYSPLKVLAWLSAMGLVKVTATKAPNDDFEVLP